MPGLSRKVQHSSPASTSSSSPVSGLCTPDSRPSLIWLRSNTEDVDFTQLEKFWKGLSAEDRRALLRIDKQALFEQVRKNLYCSRCHGLLVEGFSQIVTYGKSLHAAFKSTSKNRKVYPENQLSTSLQDDSRDPSLHPWGGLAATKDSMLTVLDCFLEGTPLEVLQNVFESARGRERERELLYPDACGGSGRGWISQSTSSYGSGRGHGMKETCALHTARLSCEALVDFWTALSEETRRSLLKMKEEDFIEKLVFRFDSKRFCRDCRRNVLREFKEMKELKRARKEPRCTRWFCAADTSFDYEVSATTVVADWHDSFSGDVETVYKRFECALGTGEGKCDIYGFEDVHLTQNIMLDNLELGTLPDVFITIRAWKRDGRFNVLSVKAHGLKGELCVHRRLFVGDGVVSITEGDSIGRFFEHAEETEEEEDEDALDKDGNELDGEGSSRSQKHAKSPELARDFLLDASTVIFKEQVEKAFREGTARQNAHSIFVSLTLGLLEDRVRVACKEIATLERQNKLLEEEEHEKREEEERRERKKMKEKEKKLRRKEKLKSKEREKDKTKTALSPPDEKGADHHENIQEKVGKSDPSEVTTEVRHVSDGSETVDMDHQSGSCNVQDTVSSRNGNGAFIVVEQTKSGKRRANGKRQQVADSRYTSRLSTGNIGERKENSDMTRNGTKDRQNSRTNSNLVDSQHCACATTTIWMKGGGTKSARKASVLDVPVPGDSKIHHVAGNGETDQKVDDLEGPGPVKSRMVLKEGLSYTKVVSRGWNEDQMDNAGKEDVSSCEKTQPEAAAHVVPEDDNNFETCDLQSVHSEVSATEEQFSQTSTVPVDDDSTSQSCKDQENPVPDLEADSNSNRESRPVEETAKPSASHAVQPSQSQGRFISSAPVHTTPNSFGTCSSTPPPAEAGRNGYVNGAFGGHSPGHKGHFPVIEMLPGPGQIRHPVHPHHHRPPLGPPPHHHHHPNAAGYYPVWSGPHHHFHHQPRNNFVPQHGGPPFLMAGPPPPAAFGYPPPRYAAIPPRMMPPPMRLPEDGREFPRPWMPRPGQATGWRPLMEGVCLGGEPFQTAAFSLQSDKQMASDFSFFHFNGPPTSTSDPSYSAPVCSGVTSSNSSSGTVTGEMLTDLPGSPTTASTATSSSASFDSGADFPALPEQIVDILELPEVTSKCMGRLASGIKSPGEYSLFAAAPGKGFGFF